MAHFLCGGGMVKCLKKCSFFIFLIGSLLFSLEGCRFPLADLFPEKDQINVQSAENSGEDTGTEDDAVSEDDAGNEAAENEVDSTEFVEKNIYVHVCGSVKNPGLYVFAQGERVDAAIRSAGGFAKDADETSVNLAELLEDGSQIEVKSLSDDHASSSGSGSGSTKVNINEADETALMTLSGIGESRAVAIISYREEHGSFSSIEELKQVDGIGDGIYQKIKNSITI